MTLRGQAWGRKEHILHELVPVRTEKTWWPGRSGGEHSLPSLPHRLEDPGKLQDAHFQRKEKRGGLGKEEPQPPHSLLCSQEQPLRVDASSKSSTLVCLDPEENKFLSKGTALAMGTLPRTLGRSTDDGHRCTRQTGQ